MKYLDEFRQPRLARQLAAAISDAVRPGRRYRIMEFCGGHTHAIYRYGLPDLMQDHVEFIHGPGCPVCVLPTNRLEAAMHLARQGVILCTYADMLRVPANKRQTLAGLKAEGLDIRSVYSTLDALEIARREPEREVVFFAIGFETTTPATAMAVKLAKAQGLRNFSVFCNHVQTPVAMRAILDAEEPAQLDGFLGPSHVSAIIGVEPYQPFADDYQKPVVIAGFEPLDILQSVLQLIRQINAGLCRVENEYSRAVSPGGNAKAKELMAEVFTTRASFGWRGLGEIPGSGLCLTQEYATQDSEQRFEIPDFVSHEHRHCECPAILRGQKKPQDCKLLGVACTPETPLGSCMVSSEGACAAWWNYGRQRAAVAV